MDIYPAEVIERFWSHTEKVGGGCRLWTAALTHNGYGLFAVGRRYKPKQIRAHRFAWIITNGPIPKGLLVLHRCDTPRCVEPEHLWLGTQKDNIADAYNKGRGPERIVTNLTKTHCPHGHPYSGSNLIVTKAGSRACKTCRNEWNRAWYSANRRSATPHNAAKTHCKRGHPLNGENLYVWTDPKGGRRARICRTCQKRRKASDG